MKKQYCVSLLIVGSLVFYTSCSENYYKVNTQVTSYAADGLDLKAVGELLKTSTDAKDLEKKLNEPNSVNNLDLDEDGKVDFIKVESDDKGSIKVLKLTAVLSGSGEEQDVATIEIERTDDKANVQVRGNEQMYGHNHYHHSSFGLGQMLLLGWMFSPRYSPYYSPFGYRSYPGYYGRGYGPVSSRSYRNRTGSLTRNSSYNRTRGNSLSRNVTSTNVKSSSRVKAPLRNPTTSQRRFQARNPSSKVRRGGFGSSRSSRSSSRSSGRSSRSGK